MFIEIDSKLSASIRCLGQGRQGNKALQTSHDKTFAWCRIASHRPHLPWVPPAIAIDYRYHYDTQTLELMQQIFNKVACFCRGHRQIVPE
jgi:hypothetical protein